MRMIRSLYKTFELCACIESYDVFQSHGYPQEMFYEDLTDYLKKLKPEDYLEYVLWFVDRCLKNKKNYEIFCKIYGETSF